MTIGYSNSGCERASPGGKAAKLAHRVYFWLRAKDHPAAYYDYVAVQAEPLVAARMAMEDNHQHGVPVG